MKAHLSIVLCEGVQGRRALGLPQLCQGQAGPRELVAPQCHLPLTGLGGVGVDGWEASSTRDDTFVLAHSEELRPRMSQPGWSSTSRLSRAGAVGDPGT